MKNLLTIAIVALATTAVSCNKDISSERRVGTDTTVVVDPGQISKDTFIVYMNDDKAEDEIHAYNLNKKEDKFLFKGSMPYVNGSSIVWLDGTTVYYGKLTADNIAYKRKVFSDPNIDIKTVQLSNDNSKIVFDTRNTVNNALGIMVIDTNGVNVKSLAVIRRNFSSISFSPDDTKLYFASQYTIGTSTNVGVIMRYTFSSAKYDTIWKATINDYNATDPLEADGKIYFIKDQQYNTPGQIQEICKINLDGSSLMQITNLTANLGWPSLSSLRRTMNGQLIYTMETSNVNINKTYTIIAGVPKALVNFKTRSGTLFASK